MFVVFEGIDGSGKTTLSNKVATALRAAGLTVQHLREGGTFASAVTQAIREFGRDSRNSALRPEAEFFLYVARDVQLLEEMTRPALAEAQVVIADRFLYSAEVLARFGRGLPEGLVRPVLEAAAGGLVPDLVVLVDIDPHLARARRQVAKILTVDKRPPSRKGLGGAGLQHRFREGYRQLAARDPQRWVVVDNDQPLEIGVERITTLVSEALAHGAAKANRPASRPSGARAVAAPIGTPAEALGAFVRWIDERAGSEPAVAAYFLTGLGGPGVDERRQLLAERAPEVMIAGLAGLDDEVSWQLRAQFAARVPQRVARSLSAIAGTHPRALPLRRALRATAGAEVLLSLDFLDDDEAWRLRDELYPVAPELAAASTMRLGSERAWALRERWLGERGGLSALSDYEVARLTCKAVSGLDDERAWELRKAAREAAPIAALTSLTYVASDRAFRWRQKWVQRAPKAIFNSLRRSDDARAWDLRERLAASCKEAVDSIQDLDGPRAWNLREACADVWPSTVVKSLGPLADTARGRELTERQLRKYPGNVSLLKHAAAIAVGAHLVGLEEA